MQELINKIKPDTALEESIKQKKEITFLHSIRPHKGHSLFKLKNGKVTKVESEEFETGLVLSMSGAKPTGKVKKKLVVDKGAAYVSALNKTNAIKKFNKQGFII